MDDRQKEAVIAYINDNVLELHGLKPAESNLLDVGGEASAADIVDARLDGADAVVLVNHQGHNEISRPDSQDQAAGTTQDTLQTGT
jgi:hypothetical protein